MIRGKWNAAVLALALVSAACTSDQGTGPVRIEPSAVTIRLVAGGKTIEIEKSDGAVTGGGIVLALNATSLVTATFLRTNRSPDPLVLSPDYELRVTPSSSSVTFARTGPFAGTLRGTVLGASTVTFQLYSNDHGHREFQGDVPISITSLDQ